MGTNPLGKGTKNVSVNMTEELRDSVAALAEASGLTLSAYVKAVLSEAVADGAKINMKVDRSQLPKSESSEEK